jgi:signal transduction histidine kinase
MSDGATIGIRLDITELKKAETQHLALVDQSQRDADAQERRSARLGPRSLLLLCPVIPSTIRIVERIGRVPLLLAGPDQLHQLLINLVTNAAQAIGDLHGTISIELAAAHDTQAPQDFLPPSDSWVRLSVSDTGCGMDEATMKHIFDPFFTTKAVGHGNSLGLSIVHGIVSQHGGRIVIESELGRGTRFHLYLPLFASETAPLEARQSPSEVGAARL